jgi:NTE family protein
MTQWNESGDARGAAELPLKPTGAPIDHYSRDSVELLRDAAVRWRDRREIPHP